MYVHMEVTTQEKLTRVRSQSTYQWSFRGGTRGNAVPIVKIPLERMGTAFPLLSYGENAWERCCIVTKLPNTVPLGHKHITIYFLKCILLSKKKFS